MAYKYEHVLLVCNVCASELHSLSVSNVFTQCVKHVSTTCHTRSLYTLVWWVLYSNNCHVCTLFVNRHMVATNFPDHEWDVVALPFLPKGLKKAATSTKVFASAKLLWYN